MFAKSATMISAELINYSVSQLRTILADQQVGYLIHCSLRDGFKKKKKEMEFSIKLAG